MQRLIRILFIALLLCFGSSNTIARIDVQRYGVVIDSNQAKATATAAVDSLVRLGAAAKGKAVLYGIDKPRLAHDSTIDFYLVLLLCLLLGIIRFSDPHYFSVLVRSFRNPSGSRHFKEQIQGASVSNLLMNVFFAIITGAYVYYAGRALAVRLSDAFDGPMMLMVLIGGVLAIYLGKYFVIRFSGWAFRVETITEQYLFNVFLINKIIGIALLPFVVLIAFAGAEWVAPLIVISLMIIALLLFNRYTRSWQVFGSFFQYSKFHFFTYLCASEILPMAILIKLLLRTMA